MAVLLSYALRVVFLFKYQRLISHFLYSVEVRLLLSVCYTIKNASSLQLI